MKSTIVYGCRTVVIFERTCKYNSITIVYIKVYIYIMYLADAFIQSDLHAFRLYIFSQYMCSLGTEPTTFALLTQCSTTEPQEHYLDFFLAKSVSNMPTNHKFRTTESDLHPFITKAPYYMVIVPWYSLNYLRIACTVVYEYDNHSVKVS